MLEFIKKKNDFKTDDIHSAIIVAAGSGSRMKSKSSKYLMSILGRPIIAYTLDVFQQSKEIDEIVIVTKEEDIVLLGEIVKSFTFNKVSKIAAGGTTRQESVAVGLREINRNTSYVLIHDGVRPFVTSAQIENCIDQAKKYEGAVVAVKAKDTLKTANEKGVICGSIDRDTTYQIQTPQCFPTHIIKRAYDFAQDNDLEATDDSSLVIENGGKIKLVEGDYDNIKITTPEDIYIAESILRKRGELFEDW